MGKKLKLCRTVKKYLRIFFPGPASPALSAAAKVAPCWETSFFFYLFFYLKGGSVLGNCAAGFGVCCVFSVSASGTTVTENSTYIINPSYPSNYVPTSTPNTLTYTIAKCQDDICRVRLDFDTFELTSPSSGGVADEGQCDTDMLAFTTTAQAVVPTTGSTGTYGSYPYICGTNTGKKKW